MVIKKILRLIRLQLWRQIHRQHISIFMIHGVTDDEYQTAWKPLRKQLSVNELDSGLTDLSKFCHFVSLEQAHSMLTGKTALLPFSVVLTFDDGYRNNITHALPVLQKHNAPASFFLSTGHVEHREPFWYDRLDYAISHLRKEQHLSFENHNFIFQPSQREKLSDEFSHLRNAIKASRVPYEETMRHVKLILSSFEENAGCSLIDTFEKDHYTAIMSWEEARCADKQGITIGSHTVDHTILDRIDEISIREQLVVSRKSIEQNTKKPCLHFCYPDGKWNNKIVPLVREAGFIAAITTDIGSNKIGDGLLTLKRFSFPKVYL